MKTNELLLGFLGCSIIALTLALIQDTRIKSEKIYQLQQDKRRLKAIIKELQKKDTSGYAFAPWQDASEPGRVNIAIYDSGRKVFVKRHVFNNPRLFDWQQELSSPWAEHPKKPYSDQQFYKSAKPKHHE